MPFDRVSEDWPPPSPEAVIRARVLSRARSLMLRRLAPVALSLMVATGVVVADRLPDGESSSQIDMLDDGGGGGGTEAEGDGTDEKSASAPSSETGAGPADAPVEVAKRAAGGPRAKAAAGAEETPGDVSTEPPAYDADVTLMTDESGDGRQEHGVCVGAQCTDAENPSQANQPALDLLELRMADDGTSIRVTTKVLDVDQEPDSSVQVNGVPASHIAYLSDLRLPDGIVRVVTVRAIADGAVTAYAYYYANQDGTGPGTRIAGVTGGVDVAANEAYTVVPMAGINAVRGSHPAVGPGTVFTPRMGVSHASTRSVGDDPGASYVYDAFETTVAAEYEV